MSEMEKRDISSLSGEELQSAVQGILKDPAFGKLLSELSGNGEPPAAKAEPATAPAIPPEMLAKLPQMLSALSPLMKGGEKEGGKGSNDDAEKRRRLLLALKPYLSDSRREAIDGIMKVTEMTDLMGKLGLGSRLSGK